jgi:hypothetical protein
MRICFKRGSKRRQSRLLLALTNAVPRDYRGHHNTKLGDRRYQIDIAIPGHDIFRGVLGFEASGVAELKPKEVRLNITETLRITRGDTGEVVLAIPFPGDKESPSGEKE